LGGVLEDHHLNREAWIVGREVRQPAHLSQLVGERGSDAHSQAGGRDRGPATGAKRSQTGHQIRQPSANATPAGVAVKPVFERRSNGVPMKRSSLRNR